MKSNINSKKVTRLCKVIYRSFVLLEIHLFIVFDCCCCSVPKSHLTLCDAMGCSVLGFPTLHSLSEFAQTQIHWVDDVIQRSHLLLPPSPAINLSQHQGLFFESTLCIGGGQSIRASASASVLPMNIQGWFPLGLTG